MLFSRAQEENMTLFLVSIVRVGLPKLPKRKGPPERVRE
jgi:hypothetical protein